MKILNRLILAAGFATMAVLLWKLNASVVWAQISKLGWGFALILAFQILDHMLNAMGWRMAFSPEDARGVPFWRLIKGRVAGDGVNYLTPSATIAGEFVRPGMLGNAASAEARNTSVVAAKFAQSLGQPLFIFLGLIFVLNGRLTPLEGHQRALAIAAALFVILFLTTVVCVLARAPSQGERFWQARGKFAAMRALMRRYLLEHPGRFVLSILFFAAGYAWGALEVLIACYFMGIAMPLFTALAVETLSNVVDILMFMVPAKVGAQEAGKTLIFRALGYPASQGLAFGFIRHARELVWSSAGFLMYAWEQKRKNLGAPPPASPRLPARPLEPADSAKL